MPKAPILSRTLYYDTLPDGSKHLLDFCTVETTEPSLGLMIEPRCVMEVSLNGKVNQVDAVDASFTDIKPMDEDEFYKLFVFGGRQVLKDF